MDLDHITRQMRSLQALLELALARGQVDQELVRQLHLELGEVKKELGKVEKQVAISNQVSLAEQERLAAVVQQFKEREYRQVPYDVRRLQEDRDHYERRALRAEQELRLRNKRITWLEDRRWKDTNEGFPLNVNDFEITDTAECPACNGPFLVHQYHDRYKCNYCAKVFRLVMPQPRI